MRKWLMILLAMVLLLGSAFAEAPLERPQRERIIYVEGLEETITEACYTGKFGYSIWVDESMLQLAMTEVECDMYLESAAADVSVLVDFVDASWEEVRPQLALLTDAHPPYSLGAESQYFIGEELEYFTRTAQAKGVCTRYYLVRMPQGMLKIVAQYPEEAAEGYGVRIDEMISTIEFQG